MANAPDAPASTSAPRRILLVLAAIGAAAGAPGCASRPQPTPATAHAASPSVRGAVSGLEVLVWVVAESREVLTVATEEGKQTTRLLPGPVFDIGPVFAPYAERQTPLDPAASERLAAGGLRLLSVPIDDLDGIQNSLPLFGVVQRQWLGESPNWLELAGAPPISTPEHITIDGEHLRLDEGRLRLLCRSWTMPDHGPGRHGAAALRIELVPQLELSLLDAMKAAPGRAGRGAEDRGPLFASLAASVTARGGEAYILIPEGPASARLDREAEEPSVFGPPAAPARTLGEAMLMPRGSVYNVTRSRIILVLIPRTPERFQLLPGHVR